MPLFDPYQNNYQRNRSSSPASGFFANNQRNARPGVMSQRSRQSQPNQRQQPQQQPKQQQQQQAPAAVPDKKPYTDPSVSFEQIRSPDDLAKLMAGTGKNAAAPTGGTPAAPVAAPVNLPVPLPEKLRVLIQNERNGCEFYARLCEKAAAPEMSDLARELRQCSEDNQRRLLDFFGVYLGADYAPAETPVAAIATFEEGLRLAAYEENTAIAQLAEAYATDLTEKAARLIGSIILNKVVKVNKIIMKIYGRQ